MCSFTPPPPPPPPTQWRKSAVESCLPTSGIPLLMVVFARAYRCAVMDPTRNPWPGSLLAICGSLRAKGEFAVGWALLGHQPNKQDAHRHTVLFPPAILWRKPNHCQHWSRALLHAADFTVVIRGQPFGCSSPWSCGRSPQRTPTSQGLIFGPVMPRNIPRQPADTWHHLCGAGPSNASVLLLPLLLRPSHKGKRTTLHDMTRHIT